MGIILLAAPYIFERKLLRFLLCIGAACLFHISSVAAIPMYFLYRKTFSKPFALLLVLSSAVCYFFNGIMIAIVGFFASFLPGRLGAIAVLYLQSSVYSGQAMFNTGIAFILNICLIVFMVVMIKPKNKRESLLFNALIAATVIKNISSGLMILDRLQPYYMMYGIILYGRMFGVFNIHKMKNMLFIYMCLIFAFFSFPFMKTRLNRARSETSGVVWYNYYNPYYHVFYHPAEAEQRKRP